MTETITRERFEAEFLELLARVEAGEVFVITRDGKPIILFGPPESTTPSRI